MIALNGISIQEKRCHRHYWYQYNTNDPDWSPKGCRPTRRFANSDSPNASKTCKTGYHCQGSNPEVITALGHRHSRERKQKGRNGK
jgi:hypothetical protein